MKKFKLCKQVVALSLVGTMAASMLTGCNNDNNNESFLSGTILEDTRVISFDDGHKDIAIAYDTCVGKFNHYNSIVTNEFFSGKDCGKAKRNFHKYNITSDESIISYLTLEEIVKASKSELTEDDISNIISRIFTKEEEQKNK